MAEEHMAFIIMAHSAHAGSGAAFLTTGMAAYGLHGSTSGHSTHGGTVITTQLAHKV